MKGNGFDNAFGRAPQRFTNRVADTLNQVQTEEARRRVPRWRMVAVAALAAVLLIGAAYAAVTQIGLTDFFAGHYRTQANQEAAEVLAFDAPLATMTVGDVQVNVTSAVADGWNVYVMASLTPASANDLLVGMGELHVPLLPADISERNLVGVKFSVSIDGATENPYSTLENPYDYVRGEGGGLVALCVGELHTEADEIEIRCEALRYEMDGISMVREETEQRSEASFTIPVTHVEQTRRTEEPVRLEEIGKIVESFSMTRTPLTTYCTVVYAPDPDATPKQKARGREPVYYYYADAQGEEYGYGTGAWNWVEEREDGAEIWTFTLSMDALPEEIYLGMQVQEAPYMLDPVRIPLDIVE